MSHRVVYADGDARVVCSCGETFTTVPPLGLSTGGNVLSGLAQWGRHQAARPVAAIEVCAETDHDMEHLSSFGDDYYKCRTCGAVRDGAGYELADATHTMGAGETS